MSNVKAIGVCICYSLNRVHLDNELKVSSEVDAQSAFQSLQQLLASNQKRNAAIAKNLNLVKDPSTKLSKMIVVDEKKENPLLLMLKNPFSRFCLIWDTVGLISLFYYAILIPFHLGFLHDDSADSVRPYLSIDFLFDLYWLCDIYLRYHYFDTTAAAGPPLDEDKRLQKHYKKSKRFLLDCVASLPLELFALIPGTNKMLLYLLRCNHLLRVSYLMQSISLIHHHLDHLQIRFTSSLSLLTLSLYSPYLTLESNPLWS
jgi:hypothetical protein